MKETGTKDTDAETWKLFFCKYASKKSWIDCGSHEKKPSYNMISFAGPYMNDIIKVKRISLQSIVSWKMTSMVSVSKAYI